MLFRSGFVVLISGLCLFNRFHNAFRTEVLEFPFLLEPLSLVAEKMVETREKEV